MAWRTWEELGPVPSVAARAAGSPWRATADTTVYPPPTAGPEETAVTAPPETGTWSTCRGRSMRTEPVEMKQAGRRRMAVVGVGPLMPR